MFYRFLSSPGISRSFLTVQVLRSTPTFLSARVISIQARSNEDLKASKLFDVSHITAVVTGGGTGIGLMITQALGSNGAKVYITGRREEALENVVKQYDTGPGKIVS
jgi:short chain dehydrogenase